MGEETEYTTITVQKAVKKDLDEQRGKTPWSAYLEELRQERADPITLNDANEIAETVKDELSMANEPGVEVDVDGLFNRIDTLEGRIKDLHTEMKTLQERLER